MQSTDAFSYTTSAAVGLTVFLPVLESNYILTPIFPIVFLPLFFNFMILYFKLKFPFTPIFHTVNFEVFKK
jgi:hypothetical protein